MALPLRSIFFTQALYTLSFCPFSFLDSLFNLLFYFVDFCCVLIYNFFNFILIFYYAKNIQYNYMQYFYRQIQLFFIK